MKEIGAFEAKNTLGALLDIVETGEEVVITRRGRLVRDTGVDRDAARKAAAEIFASSKGVTLGGVAAKHLITQGRP